MIKDMIIIIGFRDIFDFENRLSRDFFRGIKTNIGALNIGFF